MDKTTVTIRYDMIAAATSTMKTVYTRLKDKEIQQLISEIDDIRNNYIKDLSELRSEYAAQLKMKMLRLQQLLNSEQPPGGSS